MNQHVGYLRRSKVSTGSPGAFSEAEQRDAIIAMASLDGLAPEDITWLADDWGQSGGKDDRRDYVRLKEAMASGRIQRVYALNLSRIGRSLEEVLAFFKLADANRVVVRLAKDHVDTSTASGRLLLNVLASVAQFTREVAQEALIAAVDRRKARGDKLGIAAFGRHLERVRDAEGERIVEVVDPGHEAFVATLLATFEEAGSVAGTCGLLNARKVPSPRGKRWHPEALRTILDRERPGLLTRTERGRRAKGAPMITTGLLVCHCGQRMTPNPAHGRAYCLRARIDKAHGKGTVSERALLPWIAAEAARYIPIEADAIGQQVELADLEAERARLEAERSRVRVQHRAGLITDAEMLAEAAAIKAAFADLDARSRVAEQEEELPDAFDPAWPVEAQNAVLRAMWTGVRLDALMRPVAADWRKPSRRRADPVKDAA